jgi:prophage antirepressor-like protein
VEGYETPSTSTIGISSSKPSYNEGKSVYVSEPGLYSLIMKSRTSFAETFQDFVYEQILPSIRKKGRFQLEQTIALKDR